MQLLGFLGFCKMLMRILLLVKHVLFAVVRMTCKILRCGRRKKVDAVNESEPIDIVIGDSVTTPFGNSSLANGYEVPTPSFYDNVVAQQQKYPYQNNPVHQQQSNADYEGGENLQMESWDEWAYEDTNLQAGSPSQVQVQDTKDEEAEMDFFTDMEPEVKVKKIFIKKKIKSNSEKTDRLSINQDLDFKTSSELEGWQDQDDGGSGWVDGDVELDEIDTVKVAKEARELRKQERLRRSEEQKRLKLAKKQDHHNDHKLATKVS